MLTSLGEVRRLIRQVIHEGREAPYIRNAMAPAQAFRDAIGSLAKPRPGTEEDELPPHLREPKEDLDDLEGPVPQTGDNDPYAITDPYASDWHVLPRPQGKMRLT